MQQFMSHEKSSGLVLGISVLLALFLANSAWSKEYFAFFHQHFGFIFNERPFFNFSLAHWINDGFMSMFFFVVGLELKREFVGGELRQIKKVILPVGAAVLGMVMPSLIYVLFNIGTPVLKGWGIPMATDIAFALAVVYALGNKVPLTAKVFLTTLAIVDDLGSVLVIAFFYTSHISPESIAVGVFFLLIMFGANKLGVKNVIFYGVVGIAGVWTAFLMSGVHATISAVLAAFMIPADSHIPEAAFIARMKRQLKRFEAADPNDVPTLEEEQLEILEQVKTDTTAAIPPLQRLEHALHPMVAFAIMPVFALGNAGMSFADVSFSQLFSNGIAVGVALGLLLGKPLGIALAVFLLGKLGAGKRSRSMTWRRIWGLGFLASIGFTMSIFVTTLAFTDEQHIAQAKMGIFVASLVGGVVGFCLLSKTDKKCTNNR